MGETGVGSFIHPTHYLSPMPFEKKRLSLEDAIPKARTFCNYRDRCHKELRDRLYDLGVWKRDVDAVITQMIEENLLNEERYARSYVRGHFYNKKWGKQRIASELKMRHIHDRLVQAAMTEIEEEDYQKAIRELIEKKWDKLDGKAFEKKQKVSRYLAQKGFRYGEFAEALNKVSAK